MDPEVAKKLIEGYQDTITDKQKKEQQFYDGLSCPRCGSSVNKELHVHSDRGAISTTNLARCSGCKCLYQPDLNLMLEMGNLAHLEPTIPIVRGDET